MGCTKSGPVVNQTSVKTLGFSAFFFGTNKILVP